MQMLNEASLLNANPNSTWSKKGSVSMGSAARGDATASWWLPNRSGITNKGSWDALNNIPALVSGIGVKGDWYTVGSTGTTILDGIKSWAKSDIVLFDGTTW